MNKVYIISIIIAVIIILGISLSLYDNMPEESVEIILNNAENSGPKHYSESLNESAQVKGP